jgi:PEP-CTERM motif
MKKTLLMTALAAGLLASVQAAHAAPVLAGSQVTGSVSGPATALLGADSGYSSDPGSNTTTVLDDAFAQEFISDDFALIVDFGSDGRVRFFDNTGSGQLTGHYELVFQFTGLAGALPGLLLGSGPAGGLFSGELLAPDTVRFVLSDVDFGSAFGSLEATLVPEPGSLLLAGLGLAVLVRQRRRSGHSGREN